MTAIMAECVGDTGTVYAFEPTRAKQIGFTKHMKPVQSKARIILEHMALGESHGTVTILSAPSTGASRWHGDDWSAEDAPMTTLDARFPTESIDLVKIDTQGSESHILDGATNLLKRCSVWILEVWPWGLATASRNAIQVIEQLRAAGLTPHWATGAVIDDVGLNTYLASTWGRKPEHVNIYTTR